MKKLMRIALILITFSMLPQAHAAPLNSTISFNILPPVQFPQRDYKITGLRLSALWGNQQDVYGLDIGGLGNVTEGAFGGSAIAGVFNVTHHLTRVVGFQLAGGANINTEKTQIYGVQGAIGANINTAESSLYGFQFGLMNFSMNTNVYGVQVGLFNQARGVYGLQVGFINMANNVHGLQIGFLNFNETGLFAISPVLNFGW